MNWLERLDDELTPIRDYYKDADDWYLCAVNEMREKYPDVVLYGHYSHRTRVEPADRVLIVLGRQFCDAVNNDDRHVARAIYYEIKDRVATLRTLKTSEGSE